MLRITSPRHLLEISRYIPYSYAGAVRGDEIGDERGTYHG